MPPELVLLLLKILQETFQSKTAHKIFEIRMSLIFFSLCNPIWLCSSRDFSQFNSMQAFYSESTPPPPLRKIGYTVSILPRKFYYIAILSGGGYTIYHPLCPYVPRLLKYTLMISHLYYKNIFFCIPTFRFQIALVSSWPILWF